MFQVSVKRFGVENRATLLRPLCAPRYSKSTSSAVTPDGTSRWNAYMSTGSRRQLNRVVPAWIVSPARFAIGPFGACSPGIHFG